MEDRSHFASYLGYLLRRASLIAGQFRAEESVPMGDASQARRGDTGIRAAPTFPAPADEWVGYDPGELRDLAILLVLEQGGPVSQHDLAQLLDINRSMMVRVIDRLEREGYVVRARNATDRRSYALEPTTAAAGYRGLLLDRAERVSARMCRCLSVSERSRFVEIAGRLVRSESAERKLPEELFAQPVWLAVTAYHQMAERGDGRLAVLDLTIRTYVALAVLSGGAMSQAELAAHMMIGPAATVDLVDQLEGRGAVARVRHETDRRVHQLVVTPAGAELAVAGREILAGAADDFAAPLLEDDQEDLIQLLERITEPLEVNR